MRVPVAAYRSNIVFIIFPTTSTSTTFPSSSSSFYSSPSFGCTVPAAATQICKTLRLFSGRRKPTFVVSLKSRFVTNGLTDNRSFRAALSRIKVQQNDFHFRVDPFLPSYLQEMAVKETAIIDRLLTSKILFKIEQWPSQSSEIILDYEIKSDKVIFGSFQNRGLCFVILNRRIITN